MNLAAPFRLRNLTRGRYTADPPFQDFTPVGDIIMDESAAARLHRRLSLKHGSDDDSSPEVLAQQVQAAFLKTLVEELIKVNVQSEKSVDGAGVRAANVLIVEGEFTAIDEGNNPSGL